MKRIGIVLEDEIYKAVKMKLVKEEKTMKQYISELIEKDLQKKE